MVESEEVKMLRKTTDRAIDSRVNQSSKKKTFGSSLGEPRNTQDNNNKESSERDRRNPETRKRRPQAAREL